MSGRHTVRSLVCSRDPKSRIVLNASIWATRKIRTSVFFVLLHPLPVPNWAAHLNSGIKEVFNSQVLSFPFYNVERGLNMETYWQLSGVFYLYKLNGQVVVTEWVFPSEHKVVHLPKFKFLSNAASISIITHTLEEA